MSSAGSTPTMNYSKLWVIVPNIEILIRIFRVIMYVSLLKVEFCISDGIWISEKKFFGELE